MTPPVPGSNDFPRELLAAYADGELDAAARAAVERWLADHPDALDDLQAQRDLSPANVPLWERAGPPEPSSGQWAAVRAGIERRLGSPVRGRSRWRASAWAVAGLAAAGAAAAIAWVAFGPVGLPRQEGEPDSQQLARTTNGPDVAPAPREAAALAPVPRSADPLDAFAVLPIATDADVTLDRVPEFPAGWLPVGRHPVPGLVFLATEEEILLAEADAAGPAGGLKMITAPGDAPMIFAPKLR